MIAVLVVSGVGSVVDYKKEVAFVDKRNVTESEKKVSLAPLPHQSNWRKVPYPRQLKPKIPFYFLAHRYGIEDNLNCGYKITRP